MGNVLLEMDINTLQNNKFQQKLGGELMKASHRKFYFKKEKTIEKSKIQKIMESLAKNDSQCNNLVGNAKVGNMKSNLSR